jgi:lysophospholipase L1-like esterase
MKSRPLLSAVLACSLLPFSSGVSETKKGVERWEGSMAEFRKRDRETPAKEGSLLFVGSSSIRMWDLRKSWPEKPTINNGFGGSTLADSIHYFDTLFLPYQPDAIVLYAGDNDIANGLTPGQVSADFQTLASLISLAFPEVPVVFIAIKPSQKRWEMWPDMKKANDLIAAQCAGKPHFHFADIGGLMLEGASGAPEKGWFIEDGLHLSDSGYAKWTSLLKEILQKAASGKAE